MLPLDEFSVEEARAVSVVFTDIDDTLTTHGRLPADAYAALWRLAELGIAVVPVTGRPAGWCDHFARMWPVAGVVGENGAFYFRYDEQGRRLVTRFLLEVEERATLQGRLAARGEEILREVPGAAVGAAQADRLHDRAIDFCEDVPRLPEAEIQRIVELFHRAGATAKVSSIHVNGWFGSYDKLGMIRTFAAEVLNLDLDRPSDHARALYAGDSPNDEPAFAYFRNAIGVANIRAFADRLEHPPRYVTRAEGGAGFAELTRHLEAAREGG